MTVIEFAAMADLSTPARCGMLAFKWFGGDSQPLSLVGNEEYRMTLTYGYEQRVRKEASSNLMLTLSIFPGSRGNPYAISWQ